MSRHATRRSRRPLVVAAVVLLAAGSASAYAITRPNPAPAESETTAEPAVATSAEPPPAAWGPTDAEKAEARRVADALSLEELAGQLIVARHFSEEQSLRLVSELHFAGAMVTGDRILDVTTDDPLASVTDFNERLRAAGDERGVPVMIPIDQEGGLVARLREPLTVFPTAMSAGAAITGDATQGAAAVEAAARASGAELRAAGFNTVFAPDGDVTIGPADPIIGSRSPGSDSAVVAQSVTAALKGYGEAGIISSVKHFPGHNVDEDSHQSLPRLTSDVNRLRDHDLVPFVAAIEAGAPSIMTGHLDVRYVDAGTPASMSRKVITDGLRENLGYDGLIVSDSLGMGAVMSRYPDGEAAVQAIKAGSDVALMPADNEAAYAAMLAALKSGDLPEEQARASAARTIAWLNHAEAATTLPGEAGSHAAESTALTAAAVTLLPGCELPDGATSFRPTGSAELVASFTAAAQERGITLGSGPSVALLSYGSSGAAADVVVSTDTPYPLSYSSGAKVALYGGGEPAMAALLDVLTGEAEPRGSLPVDDVIGC